MLLLHIIMKMESALKLSTSLGLFTKEKVKEAVNILQESLKPKDTFKDIYTTNRTKARERRLVNK